MLHFPMINVTLTTLQFCNSVLILKSLFNSISVVLRKKLQLLRSENLDCTSSIDNKTVRRSEQIKEGENCLHLIHFYDELCDMCDALNKIFNIPLLISCISSFTYLTLSSYYAYSEREKLSAYICDIIYNILSLWITLFCCEALVEKVLMNLSKSKS